jgi:hypothetical protein
MDGPAHGMGTGRSDECSQSTTIQNPRDSCTPVKPYLSIEELAALTPWTPLAIRSKMKRGVFLENVHFFRLGRRVFFKWSAVVELN